MSLPMLLFCRECGAEFRLLGGRAEDYPASLCPKCAREAFILVSTELPSLIRDNSRLQRTLREFIANVKEIARQEGMDE